MRLTSRTILSPINFCRRFVSTEQKIDKNLLMKLRKSTGYSFINCRKALIEFGDDLESAKKWLHDLAQKEGWQKATKLSGRHAHQGLIGVLVDGNFGAMVEVNCETDFVSRNEKFHSVVSVVAQCALNNVKRVGTPSTELNKWNLDKSDLSNGTVTIDGNETKLEDFMAFNTGQLGEKLDICRGACMIARPDTYLAGYAHPRGLSVSNILLGQFGTLIALNHSQDSTLPTETLASQLCQHVVGMNPTSLGTMPTPAEKDKEIPEHENRDEEDLTTNISNETELLKQDFLLNPNIRVGDYLQSHSAVLLDFIRFNCGETAVEE